MLWTRTYADDDQRCSFCRRRENEVGELIPSPSKPLRYICAHCVAVCNGILEDRSERPAANHWPLIPDQPIDVKYKYTPEPRQPRRKR